ncbi:MAG TPA: alanyl-tRNA editing protein [Candidatus Nanoarchaeia archaeon]|nr:alanyl-tRNA editing protein [Candidatus Nanoarchaeia archaeon]
MTLRLFWKDPYQTECRAKVLSISGNEVVLDQTVFFAFAGGQASDHGTIGGIVVIEAKDLKNKITYTLAQLPDFRIGDTIEMRIDWERRARLMKLHAAVHLVSFLFAEKTGIAEGIGSNITPEKGRLDYVYPENLAALLPDLELQANRIMAENVPIRRYGDSVDPEKQWWECGKWKCLCCGTHPRSTGEIGKIKLKRANPGKGKERIEIYLTD